MEMEMEMEKEIDFETARDILSLISKRLTKKEFNKWQPVEKIRAIKYAGAVHFSASDNIVRKKELVCPIFVKRLKDIR